MRVKMFPALNPHKPGTSGIHRVVEAYHKHLPRYGIELVGPEDHLFDLVAGHVGEGFTTGVPFVCHTHGLYFTADYPDDTSNWQYDYPDDTSNWQYKVNAKVIESIRHASQVTVPSAWVAETFQRDMRFMPHIVPHGIDWQDWRHDEPLDDYVLWNKNRNTDVCDPMPVVQLARFFPDQHFSTTYLPQRSAQPSNVSVMGLVPHERMKPIIQRALVYLSTTKETFGIGVLEAMASGVPVLGVAHGGNVDLIQHGINGYLAEPGNIEDLAEGLNYCLQHRDVLGSNGRELVKQWTWDAVCEQVARIYEMALEPEPPTVAVVIPVYNKDENEFRRALNSVFGQSCRLPLEIFVIDDGSSNGAEIERVVRETKDIDAGIEVEYIYQNNSGVANARNRGVSLSRAKYICCLDSDDAIEPDFIRVCVQALEADRSLGIAYTGLRYVKPDGESVTSKWPPDSNFDNQLKKQNQIPTCCVFRREMWERLGGYNQKYAPDGAGAEDGEFWLRSGAYGWGAKKVTDEPLFVYYGGGLVGGNPDYVEPDWTASSVATPRRFSHPVRQYDEPVVSVIIPVGPGHENRVRDALDSLEAQTFRKWEAIVVWDCDTGVKAIGSTVDNDKFSIIVAANIRPEIRAIAKSYPYIHHWTTDKQGPGYARNRGAEIARAPFLVFLDADDTLYPTFYLC
jgi:glycosyltransferase involved in cell wall biosynthesis